MYGGVSTVVLQYSRDLEFSTRGEVELMDITRDVETVVKASGVRVTVNVWGTG